MRDEHRRAAQGTKNAGAQPSESAGAPLESGPRVPAGAARWQALVDLESLATQRALLGEQIREGVVAARRAGAFWSEIGLALGITRQAAAKRYRDVE